MSPLLQYRLSILLIVYRCGERVGERLEQEYFAYSEATIVVNIGLGWDISCSKTMSGKIRAHYYSYLTDSASSFKPGARLKVSRENLVKFVERSFDEVNAEQRFNRSITRSFQICGLDPWAESLVKFTKHLDSLTTTKVYETLVKHQEAITI